MNESVIVQKLKKLQSIQPSKEWEAKQSAVMEAQVYNSSAPAAKRELGFFSNFLLLFKATFSQPGIMVGTILTIIIVGGGLATYVVGRQAKPGDSLYFAKEINDQVKLALRFDQEEQNKLKLAMAQERVNEMANLDQEADKEKAEAISKEFKSTLNEVKEELAKASQDKSAVIAARKNNETTPVASAVASNDNNNKADNNKLTPEGQEDNTASTSSEEGTFSVATGQTKDGRIEISEPVNVSARQMIEEAETSFANADYAATLDKLQAVSELLDSAK
jgi:peptide deformylase